MNTKDMTEQELTALLEADGALATERLDHWAHTTGERTFFYYGEDDGAYTYAEFGALTDHIAGNLTAHGITKGDRVSVFSSNPLMSSLVMFGIWKAGAVYCPINFSYTGRLLAYQLNDTAPRMVITHPELLPALNAVAGELADQPTVVVYAAPNGAHDHVDERDDVDPRLTEIAWSALTETAERPAVTTGFDDPANVVYTSGTTGPAKGVLQPHRWMNQYTYALRMPLCSDDVIYNDLPMYHVGGAVANIVRAVWVGCEVAVWNRFSPSAFWDRINARGATTAILLDVMIPWLTKASENADDRDNTLNKVYLQPLPAGHAAVARRFGFDVVLAGFGQTESGNPLGLLIEETAAGEGTPPELYRGRPRAEIRARAAAAGIDVVGAEDVSAKGLMGLPTPFMDVAVLDDHDQICALDEPGQLAIRPRLPGLIMREYLGKPAATVAAWRNLWFHTGDSATRRADGTFAFLDRLGDRIRVRGENLSSFQVEDSLLQHPAVALVAAFAIPSDEGGEDDIVVFASAEAGVELTVEQLHEYAASSVPKYMRPRHIRVVAEIPRTPTNKIEKYKLRKQILSELGRAEQ